MGRAQIGNCCQEAVRNIADKEVHPSSVQIVQREGWTIMSTDKLNWMHNCSIREGSRYQIGWSFGKVPKGGGSHFQSKNLYCRFWTFFRTFMKTFCNIIFRKWGGVEGHLECFRKFIRFGAAILPLENTFFLLFLTMKVRAWRSSLSLDRKLEMVLFSACRPLW